MLRKLYSQNRKLESKSRALTFEIADLYACGKWLFIDRRTDGRTFDFVSNDTRFTGPA